MVRHLRGCPRDRIWCRSLQSSSVHSSVAGGFRVYSSGYSRLERKVSDEDLVPIKQVVDYDVMIHVKPYGSGIGFASAKTAMNIVDKIAVGQVLRQKTAGKAIGVVVVSIGLAQLAETLKIGLAMRANDGVHIKIDGSARLVAGAKLLKVLVHTCEGRHLWRWCPAEPLEFLQPPSSGRRQARSCGARLARCQFRAARLIDGPDWQGGRAQPLCRGQHLGRRPVTRRYQRVESHCCHQQIRQGAGFDLAGRGSAETPSRSRRNWPENCRRHEARREARLKERSSMTAFKAAYGSIAREMAVVDRTTDY